MRTLIENLESRQLLSVSPVLVAPVEVGSEPAIAMPRTAYTLAPNTYYLTSATMAKIAGKFAIKITKVVGTAITAKVWSGSWGGFSVTVTGSINSSHVVKLSGKNANTNVKSISGTLSSTNKTITGKCTIVHMGSTLSASITLTKQAAQPVLAAPSVPSMVGHYAGKTNNGEPIAINISQQQGCLLWGSTSDGGTMKGFEYMPGKFRFVITHSDGYNNIMGTRASDGSLSGTWVWYGTGASAGQTGSGTFSLAKV